MNSDPNRTQPHLPADTVLVVEDEVLVRVVISEYLRRCGYKVIEAVSADEAILVLQKADLRVDVVFSDIEMSGSMDVVCRAGFTIIGPSCKSS